MHTLSHWIRVLTPRVTLTGFLAVWGALLSSFTVGWNWYRDLGERPKLKVSAKLRRIVQDAIGRWYAIAPDLQIEGASEKLYIVIDVANVSKRPRRWVGWGG